MDKIADRLAVIDQVLAHPPQVHCSEQSGAAPGGVWGADVDCYRFLAEWSRPGALTPETTSIRGVPAAFFEDGHRLEIQTGTSTVVVFARSRDEVLQVASALRGVNLPVQASDRLPQPAAGALDGKLGCG